MTRTRLFPLMFLLFLAAACQEEDHFLDVPVSATRLDSSVLSMNILQNQWIYSQMNLYYFWADQLRDSSSYDYGLNPERFFESLLVDEDRFSFSEPNEMYRTKGTNLNATVKLDSIYNQKGKRIGYFYYSGFETEADITDVILKMKGIDELIVDVRSNPGGRVETCIHLASLIAPQGTGGKLFCSYKYNARTSTENKKQTGDERSYSFFREDYITQSRSLGLNRVFILTGEKSASASELLIIGLRPYMNVITVGGTTRGKDVGMRSLRSQSCSIVLWPITFRTFNADNDSVPVTGIVPTLFVDNTHPGQLGDTMEPLLKAALAQID